MTKKVFIRKYFFASIFELRKINQKGRYTDSSVRKQQKFNREK